MAHARRIATAGSVALFLLASAHGPPAATHERNAHPEESAADERTDQKSAADREGRWRITSGSKWEEFAAYSRAVVDGRWIFISGTVGFDPEDSSIPDDFDAQMDLIFATLQSTLEEAGSSLDDIVQVRSYLVDTRYIDAMAAKLREYLDDVRPTNATIITELAAEGALVELEVTALRQQ